MAAILGGETNAAVLIQRAIMSGLRKGAQIVRNHAVLNVTGRVLKRDTGRLASSITTSVSETAGGGILRVGTRVNYGIAWELGFASYIIRPKQLMSKKSPTRFAALRFVPKGSTEPIFRRSVRIPAGHRPWLRPAAEQALPQVTRIIQGEVNRALQQFGGTRTIDIRIT